MTLSNLASEQWVGDSRQKTILLGAVLVLTTLLLYAPVAHHEFLDYDDSQYVTKNVHVRSGLNFGNVAWAFTSFDAANWHPLTWLSHMADCQLFGLNPGAHHLVNVVLHAGNVLLLFLLLQQGTRAVWRSFLVAALFGVHPLNVETVAWVAQRKSLLSTLFSLLMIAAYGWYVRRPDWKKYLAVCAALLLALLSKPMAVSLPFVLLLLDYWPLNRYEDLPFRRKWARLWLEKVPMLLMSAASASLTIAAQRSGGAVAELAILPLPVRLENAVVSYVAYIGKTFWPANLAVFYPHPEHLLPWPKVGAAAVVLGGVTALVLHFRRARYVATGWFLFLVALAPVIGVVQVGRQAMADRYAYIPCIGLFIIISWGLSEIAEAISLPRVVPAITSLCLVVAFVFTSRHDLQYWQNGVQLFMRARAVAPRPDAIIEEALADALGFAGRVDEALEHYRASCTALPTYDLCHYNIAEILFIRHQPHEAIEECRLAESFTDNRDVVFTCSIHSGKALLELGKYDAAEKELEMALKINPTNQTALLLRQRNSYQRSISNGQALALAPSKY
ncbi:MAG: tetratricopeptide repeat protein [Terriglobales bacterium]|jgi:tetratricopeptide (TPR) repeat protein